MKGFKRYKIFSVLALVLVLSCAEDRSKQEQYTLSGNALGTTFNLIYFTEENFDPEPEIDSIINAVNQSMSTYIQNSDISRINKGDSTVIVDSAFIEVFEMAKTVNKNSKGYFDPTVGKLVNAYGFGSEKPLAEMDSSQIDSILNYIGFDKISISAESKIIKEHPDLYLEFNAIAKGYAVDLFARYFDSKNVNNYLLELGGELVAKGNNLAKEKDWIVAIDNPFSTESERSFHTTLRLKNKAMATSGNYRKFRIDSVSGRKFVHTINPLTGYPEKSNVLSVSILAENCALADAYATACMAMGLKNAKQMLAQLHNIDAYIIYTDEKNNTAVFATEGFKEVLLD